MPVNYCSSCKTPLLANAKKCKSCGWKADDTDDTPFHDRHRCAYSLFGRQCPLPGTMSHATNGGGRFYCGGHFKVSSGPKAVEIFEDASKNYHKIMSDRQAESDYIFNKVKAKAGV